MLPRALVGGLSLSGFYGLVRLGSNGGVGMGDVKLAVPLGTLTSALGWKTFVLAFIITSFLGGVTALIVLISQRGKTTIPYGPVMLCGALVACSRAML